ncbi:hypothetical protein OV208_06550 [Corallococcus sp. bb12-1]|uniref:LVIVD repeat-containing protein n=1 Tax=Corallococcus sp. bb12-1 TaxID=2996784 RepID=UPI00226D84FF|nr:hypothetical protein [Corallococcus sp. bb12-1]MCY1040971.1 hypothetical protein [Corallococcus sp. bb12-1]
MSRLPRWLLLFTTALALSGCSSSTTPDDAGPAPVDAGTSDAGGDSEAGDNSDAGSDAGTDTSDAGSVVDAGTSDAGTDLPPWDGTAETLPERTDHVDRGLYSDCAFTLPVGAPVAACNDASLFDRSSCPSGAFDSVDTVGFYAMDARPSTGYVNNLSAFDLRLPLDGSAGNLSGRALTHRAVGAGEFVAATTYVATRINPARDFVFAGCTRPTPDRINGCYVQCSQGKVGIVGTFTATRAGIPARGESESSGLTLVSEATVPLGMAVDVYVAKDHAYVVADGHASALGGLAVFDVTNRAHPVLKKVIQLPNDTLWNGVWAKGDALYIASASSGVIVYDISDPADPQYVRAVPGEPTPVHTVHVQGDRLYAMAPAQTDAVLLFDVSSPLAPVLLNKVSLQAGGNGPHDAFAYQDRLYVSYTESGYVAFDVKDAEHIEKLGSYVFDGQFAHASAVGTFAGRTLAFEGGEFQGSHLRVLDVTDPANMRLIGEYGLRPEFSIHNMILKGTRLYVAYYQEGVRVLDVSVPPKPREVAYFNTYRETEPGRIGGIFEGAIGIRVPDDGYVYVVDTHRGLLILREP